jgi:zinc finger CCCH domain-containing protein 13
MYPFQSSNSLPPVSSQQVHQQALSAGNRLDSLYDSGLDDRAFVPDGLVPGLRSSGTRGRDNAFSEQMDDPMKFNMQRTPAQRTPDQMFGGSAPSMYAQQTVGRNTIPIQPQYRRGPSPIQTQNPLASGQQQRLPPGLANLGGRPPHEPSLYLNPQLGLPHNAIHGAAHANGQSAQSFGFVPGGGVGYGGIPQMRGAPPGLHQLQSPLGHGSMAGLGVHPASIELRGSNQAQLLAMSGGLRGGGAGFTQQSLTGQVHSPLLIRPQQQQHQHQHHQQQLPPHMMPHIGPSHQPQGLATADTQPAHDLMALLMGGSRG